MTRKTKIGLLVGLAFIIVIGILLSDHLTSSTEPPQAPLANAGNTVRQAVTSPGSPAPALPQVLPPTSTPPQNQVATQNELAPRPDPVQIVKVGPGPQQPSMDDGSAGTSGPRTANVSQPAVVARTSDEASNEVAGADAPTITRVPPAAASPITQVAQQHGEELVSLNGTPRTSRALSQPTGRNNSGFAEYKVEPGDSLSKMAMRFLGSNTKANRDAIVAANPSLLENPDKVIVGKTYLIPTQAPAESSAQGSSAAPTLVQPASTMNLPVNNPSAPAARSAERELGEYWYTVKEGDSLWRIAKEQLGKPGAVAAIKELNKDTLGGEDHDIVVIGTKLRLPGKPIAQAN